jgi:hypothetical protein
MLQKLEVTHLKTVLKDTKHTSWRVKLQLQDISYDPLLPTLSRINK